MIRWHVGERGEFWQFSEQIGHFTMVVRFLKKHILIPIFYRV